MPTVQVSNPAVISYLDIHKDNFYRMETSVDGRMFATARGWEDLSRLIRVYEKLEKTVDKTVVVQYIQHRRLQEISPAIWNFSTSTVRIIRSMRF